MFAYGKHCFIETCSTRRTRVLALEFINKVQNQRNSFTNINSDTISYVQKAMIPVTMEIKTIEKGNFAGLRYIEFNGKNFSTGCDASKNPLEECIIV